MNQIAAQRLLAEVKDGKKDVPEALRELQRMTFVDLGYARVDVHRASRRGFPEVIFCQGKEPCQVAQIAATLYEHHPTVLATRANQKVYDEVRRVLPEAKYHERARIVSVTKQPVEHRGCVLIVSAGTSDLPIAEEARVCAEMMGCKTATLYDAGVAGIHRLLADQDVFRNANVVIVVAGMEGALPSVVAGLVDVPVIAVPTSVGYGLSLGGIAPLLTMLNSCAAGVAVVNIDNGFGAAYVASQINRRVVTAKKST